MAVQLTQSGKIDKRTKEGKAMLANLAKARKAAAKKRKAESGVQRTKSGKIDKRTKEGKAMLENLAKARRAAAKKRKQEDAKLMKRISRLFK